MNEGKNILLAHGEGGLATKRLIDKIFAPKLMNPILARFEDSAILEVGGEKIAFSTDGFIIEPIIFPGGDIGKLAVTGTVNDLAAMAAKPLFFSAAFLIEEGVEIDKIEKIAESFAVELDRFGAILVAADTKVVPRGHGGEIYISVSGIGEIKADVHTGRIRPGDELVLSGDIARHSAAIIAVREEIETDPPLLSDCASLWELVESAIARGVDIHAMRDATRGGLATILVEIAKSTGYGITIAQSGIPIAKQVAVLCDIYGFDPLYLANEGKMVFFVEQGEGKRLVEILSENPLAKDAAVIGCVEESGEVIIDTTAGGRRKLIMLEGEQLPRIC